MPTGQTRRRCHRGNRKVCARTWVRTARAGRYRTIGTEGDIDMAGLERGDQGNARYLDVANDERRHVQGAILDHDDRTISLFEHKVVAVDLDVVDRDVGRKLYHVAGVGHVFVGRSCRRGLRLRRGILFDGRAAADIDGYGLGRHRLGGLRYLHPCLRRRAATFRGRVLIPRIRDGVQFVTVRHNQTPPAFPGKRQ